MDSSNFSQKKSQRGLYKKWMANNFMDAPLKWIMLHRESGRMIRVWAIGTGQWIKISKSTNILMVAKVITIKTISSRVTTCRDQVPWAVDLDSLVIQWWECNSLCLTRWIQTATQILWWIACIPIWIRVFNKISAPCTVNSLLCWEIYQGSFQMIEWCWHHLLATVNLTFIQCHNIKVLVRMVYRLMVRIWQAPMECTPVDRIHKIDLMEIIWIMDKQQVKWTI